MVVAGAGDQARRAPPRVKAALRVGSTMEPGTSPGHQDPSRVMSHTVGGMCVRRGPTHDRRDRVLLARAAAPVIAPSMPLRVPP